MHCTDVQVVPALEQVDTPDELMAALEDPEAFLKSMASSLGPVGIRLAIAKLRPKLEPVLKKQGLSWTDVRAAHGGS